MILNAAHTAAIQGAHQQGHSSVVLDGIGAASVQYTYDEDDYSYDEYLMVLLPGDIPLFVEVR